MGRKKKFPGESVIMKIYYDDKRVRKAINCLIIIF